MMQLASWCWKILQNKVPWPQVTWLHVFQHDLLTVWTCYIPVWQQFSWDIFGLEVWFWNKSFWGVFFYFYSSGWYTVLPSNVTYAAFLGINNQSTSTDFCSCCWQAFWGRRQEWSSCSQTVLCARLCWRCLQGHCFPRSWSCGSGPVWRLPQGMGACWGHCGACSVHLLTAL